MKNIKPDISTCQLTPIAVIYVTSQLTSARQSYVSVENSYHISLTFHSRVLFHSILEKITKMWPPQFEYTLLPTINTYFTIISISFRHFIHTFFLFFFLSNFIWRTRRTRAKVKNVYLERTVLPWDHENVMFANHKDVYLSVLVNVYFDINIVAGCSVRYICTHFDLNQVGFQMFT